VIDEVPKSVASIIGHVCGVIAVAMAALGLFGVTVLFRKPSGAVLLLVALATAMTVLMVRWAGALTGYWDTRGRLAVSKFVYSLLGALFVALALLGIGLMIASPPLSVGEGLTMVIGAFGSGAMAYLCYLAYRRFE
jgi:hypothetical protein